VSRDGESVYISDEYGPYLCEFDRRSGERLRAFELPAKLAVAVKAPTGAAEIAGNASGRVANKGMEGLAISPDGRSLFGFVQSPLIEDGGDGGRANRIVRVDIRSGAVTQYAYDVVVGGVVKHTLFVANDNDFIATTPAGNTNPNQWFVFTFTADDLAGSVFIAQKIEHRGHGHDDGHDHDQHEER